MDEPTSALDPISTAKMEELMDELKKQYTVIIVTHNMQQASRIADYTSFFYLGELIETQETEKLFKCSKASREICELRNIINVGYLIMRQAKERHNSRGLHYTIDYPPTSDHK